MKIITAEWLENAGACEGAVDDFRETFGEWCPLDAQNVALWIERFPRDANDDFYWLAFRLMSSFDIRILEELERQLSSKTEADESIIERIGAAADCLTFLEDDKIAKVIEEIADRSAVLDATTEAALCVAEKLPPQPEV